MPFIEEKKIRAWYICPFRTSDYSCPKQYANKHSVGCLKHFHTHLQDPRCSGIVKEAMMKYEKDNGIMIILQKRGHVKIDLVAGWLVFSQLHVYYKTYTNVHAHLERLEVHQIFEVRDSCQMSQKIQLRVLEKVENIVTQCRKRYSQGYWKKTKK